MASLLHPENFVRLRQGPSANESHWTAEGGIQTEARCSGLAGIWKGWRL